MSKHDFSIKYNRFDFVSIFYTKSEKNRKIITVDSIVFFY